MFDVIVVGVGGMGSAAIDRLARRECKVLGLERFDIPHELGSSHGASRIIRLAYAEDPRYVPLLRRSYELWRELENRAGERLLFITGGIDAGDEHGAIVQGSLRSCAIHHLPHELLGREALRARFPGFRLKDGMAGVYQADAGFLIPERCIVASVVSAQQHGAEIHTREAVTEWHVRGASVIVKTDRDTYEARKMIVTAGPWAREIVPLLDSLAVPERQVVIWTQPLRPELFAFGAFPIFNMDSPEGHFYGFPVYGVPGFKIGRYHHREERVDPDSMNRDCDREDEEVLRRGIRAYFPDANGPTMAMQTCLFTNSPDEHFILDFHPQHRNVVIAAGFSGHGFKFCSVVGEIMAGLALDGATSHDIGMFRLGRFAYD